MVADETWPRAPENVHAATPVAARLGCALVHVGLAVFPAIAGGALAHVSISQSGTPGAMLTRHRQALVDISCAKLPDIACWAYAGEAADGNVVASRGLDALPPVPARTAHALVDVGAGLAVPSEAGRTAICRGGVTFGRTNVAHAFAHSPAGQLGARKHAPPPRRLVRQVGGIQRARLGADRLASAGKGPALDDLGAGNLLVRRAAGALQVPPRGTRGRCGR